MGRTAAALLEELIALPTHNPGGDEEPLAEHLGVLLRPHAPDVLELGRVSRADGRRGAWIYAAWGPPRVLVNAHIDTVPPNRGWLDDPFRARRVDGRIIGLGASDVKGSVAALLAALDDVRPDGLALLFSGDEESTTTCVTDFIASGRQAGTERVIVCEPTSARVGVRHRGILSLAVTFVGEGGHSMRADHLPAPVATLARLAVAWHDWGAARRDDGPPGFPGLCMNVASLDGGVAFNVVPREACLTASVRPPPGSDLAAIEAELVSLAHAAVPSATVEVPLRNPPFATRDVEPFRALLGDAVDRTVDLGFWTEAALWSAAGLDAVVFGPGDIGRAHAAEEWIGEDELDAGRAAFAGVFAAARDAGGT